MDVSGFYASTGGDYDTALSRLMKDSMAEKFILKFLNDKSFETLKCAVEVQNWDDAFKAAHTLKSAE